MAVFGISTNGDSIISKYMNDIHKRLQNENLVKNPYNGLVKKVPSEMGVYVVIMDAVYPKVYLWGFVLLAITLLFSGFRFSLWLLPSMFIFSTGILWTKLFLYFVLCLGAKKQKYRGHIKLLSNSDLIRLLM